MARKPRRSSITDYRLVAVDPVTRQRHVIVLAIALLVLLALAATLGYRAGTKAVPSNEKQLAATIAQLHTQQDALKRQLSVYQTDEDIANEASDSFRADYKELRNQLSELSEAVSFYKGIMDPADRSEGLHIEHLSITPGNAARQYHFKLILTQVGNNKWRSLLKGEVHWQLTGHQNGKPLTLSETVFVNQNSAKQFSFRYFQELTGSLTLPAGVEPDSLIVTAEARGAKKYLAEHTFKWTKVEKK